MATFINTDAAGRLTYEIQPEEERTLFKNLTQASAKDLARVENEISDIMDVITGEDVKSDLTITPDTNCESCEIIAAIKKDNNLYIQFTATPSVELSEAGNLYLYIKGFTPAIHPTWRFAIGSSTIAFLLGWISSYDETKGYRILCKRLASGSWPTTATVTFNGIIPLETGD